MQYSLTCFPQQKSKPPTYLADFWIYCIGRVYQYEQSVDQNTPIAFGTAGKQYPALI
jgi:hypothetical protein